MCSLGETQAFLLKTYRNFNTEPFCSDVTGINDAPKLWRKYAET